MPPVLLVARIEIVLLLVRVIPHECCTTLTRETETKSEDVSQTRGVGEGGKREKEMGTLISSVSSCTCEANTQEAADIHVLWCCMGGKGGKVDADGGRE